eukprot:TRINITY_DN38172_c0_g1_i1.p1 TRINITY_DN38172_c0_g1~~TRINITY_DN38172_c0_g1_i1.p1  ORF type:complete len:213 (-),score=56.14 TRINITY_DN38172_c0_g1_i1:139-756(-)
MKSDRQQFRSGRSNSFKRWHVLALLATACWRGTLLPSTSGFLALPRAAQTVSRREAALSPWASSAAFWVQGSLPARAEIIRMKLLPLPKPYRDSVTAAALALKEALEEEQAVGDAFLGPAAEAKLAAKEQKAGQLIRSYGETYISEKNGLKPDDPLRESAVFFFMDEAIELFQNAVKDDQLPQQRPNLIAKLRNVLELAEKAGAQ